MTSQSAKPPTRLLVVGGSGHVGRHVLAQASRRDHSVRAAARRIPGVLETGAGVEWIALDLLDGASVMTACADVDVIINTSGSGTSRSPTRLYSQGTAHLLEGMRRHGVRRLITLSAVVAGQWNAQPLLRRTVLLPILDRVFAQTYQDMRRMDALLAFAPEAWTVIRAPRITSGASRGPAQLGTDQHPPSRGSVPARDLATLILDLIPLRGTARATLVTGAGSARLRREKEAP